MSDNIVNRDVEDDPAVAADHLSSDLEIAQAAVAVRQIQLTHGARPATKATSINLVPQGDD
jgi:hypothetical protein